MYLSQVFYPDWVTPLGYYTAQYKHCYAGRPADRKRDSTSMNTTWLHLHKACLFICSFCTLAQQTP